MKKKLAVALVAAFAVTALAGCGGKNDGKNTAPEITGVPDEATAQAGVEFDALKGVKANDKEDGDITSKITVESSALTFTNGKVTPAAPGNYELIYEVKDKGGLIANAYCTLTVTPAVGEEAGIYDFDFENDAPVDAKGWAAAFDGAHEAAGTASFKQGAYMFEISNSGTAAEDITLKKTIDVAAANYTVKVWLRSSQKTCLSLVAAKEDGGMYGASAVQTVETASTAVELKFDCDAEGQCEIALNLGKQTDGETTSPDSFTLSIDKIELVKTVGTETANELYSQDFSVPDESVTANFWDASSGSVTNEDGAAQVNVTSYRGSEGGVWSTHFFVGLGNTAIEEGKKYSYSLDVTALHAQTAEFFLVTNGGDANKIDTADGGFSYALSLPAGQKKTLTGSFVADKNVSDPALRFQIGNAAEGVTDNVFTVDNVTFSELVGDKEETTQTDTFVAEGAADQPWTTYNEGGGVGAVYTEDGKLVYRIEQFGTADWHNKLVVGYDKQPLELPPFAYITISITVKASANVSCDVHLHEIGGNWDTTRPISGTMNITTTEQTFTFTTAETLFDSGNYELLFQNFKCAESGVTVEISSLTVTQRAFL